jgi:rsbT antagonist protein RsbS
MSGACPNISVIKIRDILMVTMPPDPDDSTVAALQDSVLNAMERYAATGLILDLSSVETLDSFFARTVSETAQMVMLMGGRTIIVGMQPAVAVTATQMGLTLNRIETALNVDRALDLCAAGGSPRILRSKIP